MSVNTIVTKWDIVRWAIDNIPDSYRVEVRA